MTVVAAYAPDEFGRAAVEAALVVAASRGTDVVVVNASRGDALVDERYAQSGQLHELEDLLAAATVGTSVRQSVGGDVAEQVIEVLEEVGGTLLVVGLRHRSPIGKMLMGSVAQRLLLDSPVPVLSVKPGQHVEP